MSKPVLEIEITTADDQTGKVQAVFDTGAFYTLVREDKVPSAPMVLKRKTPLTLRAATKGATLTAVAEVSLVLTIGGRKIHDVALVSPELRQEMLVGAGTMQKWDISILNKNGRTEVSVGRDMHDPDVTEVD